MKSFCLTLLMAANAAHADCGANPEPCRLPGGTYHVAVPAHGAGPFPAVVLLHGYGGDGLGMIRNESIIKPMLDRGYAVIAPDGQPLGDGNGRAWDFHPDLPATRDEATFLDSVADDAAARFDLKRDKMMLAGFSIGGSMTSYVACLHPTAFAAYAPVAGSFWRPHPQGCAGPVNLFHTHGTSDRTVPLEGREIAPGFAQGNVFEAMEIWRVTDGCPASQPGNTQTLGIYEVHDWKDCTTHKRLDFALHDGDHIIPKGWAKMVTDWFETLS